MRQELPVETFCQFLVSRIPDRQHLAGKIEGLVGKRMVEVHLHRILENLLDGTVDHIAHLVDHREGLPDHKELVVHLPVQHEGSFRKTQHHCRFGIAVAFCRGEGEGETIARLLALEIFLEFRKKHIHALDVVKRTLLDSSVNDCPVHFELIGELYHFVLFYFHCLFRIFCLYEVSASAWRVASFRSNPASGAEVHVFKCQGRNKF